MRQETPYRQMELGDNPPGAQRLSYEQMRAQAEQARQTAARLDQQSRDIEQSDAHKDMFNDELNDLGMRLHNAVNRLDRELESMDREQREVEQITKCLKLHLQILSSLQPDTWSPAEYQQRISEALPKLTRAENDFDEAYSYGRQYRHTSVFLNKPGEEEAGRFGWVTIGEQMAKGLAFHLPLFILILLAWGVWQLILTF